MTVYLKASFTVASKPYHLITKGKATLKNLLLLVTFCDLGCVDKGGPRVNTIIFDPIIIKFLFSFDTLSTIKGGRLMFGQIKQDIGVKQDHTNIYLQRQLRTEQ